MSYTPPEPAQYSPEGENAPDFTVQNAINPALNGPVVFRYPSAWEEVTIGTRMAELCSVGQVRPVAISSLPYRAQLFVRAIAHLERCIKTAPTGFYLDAGNGPVLSPGSIGGGDEGVLLQLLEAFEQWRERFRDAARAAKSGKAQTVVRGDEADGGPASGDDEQPGGGGDS